MKFSLAQDINFKERRGTGDGRRGTRRGMGGERVKLDGGSGWGVSEVETCQVLRVTGLDSGLSCNELGPGGCSPGNLAGLLFQPAFGRSSPKSSMGSPERSSRRIGLKVVRRTNIKIWLNICFLFFEFLFFRGTNKTVEGSKVES